MTSKQARQVFQGQENPIRIFKMNIHTKRIISAKQFTLRYSYNGFTYIGILIFIAILAITGVATLQVGQIIERRSAEQELLHIGREFRNALISYAVSTPIGTSKYPRQLEDLLLDPRYTQKKRHLRQIYIDPITGNQSWGIISHPAGFGIIGIHSLSSKTPIKIGNFDTEFHQFNDKATYREWIFSVDN